MVSSAAGAPSARQIIGADREDLALRYLRTKGLTLVERNFRCKAGEIDLILREGDTLVFVECGPAPMTATAGRLQASRRPSSAACAARYYLQRLRTVLLTIAFCSKVSTMEHPATRPSNSQRDD